jgi:hypothetical protein
MSCGLVLWARFRRAGSGSAQVVVVHGGLTMARRPGRIIATRYDPPAQGGFVRRATTLVLVPARIVRPGTILSALLRPPGNVVLGGGDS